MPNTNLLDLWKTPLSSDKKEIDKSRKQKIKQFDQRQLKIVNETKKIDNIENTLKITSRLLLLLL